MSTEGYVKTCMHRAWRVTGVIVAILLGATLALGQGGRRRGMHGPQGGGRMGQGPRMGPMTDPHKHPPGFMKRLRDLPPQEQERVLANDQRFQSLPPARQAMIRENLRRWNALTPEQKQRLRERQEVFESLSPEQRQQARTIFPQWRQLEPHERQEVMQAFRELRALPPEKREQFLASPENQKRFTPEQRRVLEGLNRLLPRSGLESMEEPED